MRFALTQKLLTYALAIVATIPLALSGEVDAPWTALLLLTATAGWFLKPAIVNRAGLRRGVTAAVAVVLGVQIWRYITGAPLPQLAMELTFALLGAKLCTRGTAGDHYQIAALSFVQVIAATIAIDDLSYAGSFVLFVAIAPPMLAVAYLRREMEKRFGSDPRGQGPAMLDRLLRSKRIISPSFVAGSAALSLPVLIITAILFVGFPRIGWGLLGKLPQNKATVGFGDSVGLDDFDLVRQDETVVVRLEPLETRGSEHPPFLPLRLRGAAFDIYRNNTWSRSPVATFATTHLNGDELLLASDKPRASIGEYELMIEPLDIPVLFIPDRTERIRTFARSQAGVIKPRPLEINSLGEVRYRDEAHVGVRYQVRLAALLPPPGKPPSQNDNHLDLGSQDPRMAALARQFAGEGNEIERARHLAEELRTGYKYSLELSSSEKNRAEKDPLTRFLFSRKTGTCEHFATALTLLLRYEGIPARIVTGFLGAEWNPVGGFYAVRQKYAHSWTEAWINESWQTFDATPPATTTPHVATAANLTLLIEALRMHWHKYIVGFDASVQLEMARSLRKGLDRPNLPELSPGRALRWLLIVTAVTALLFLLRRLLRIQKLIPQTKLQRARAAEAAQATKLYRSLERALKISAAARPIGTTPLEHVAQLSVSRPALAGPALLITQRYLEVRFGLEHFSQGEIERLEATIKEITRTAASRPETQDSSHAA